MNPHATQLLELPISYHTSSLVQQIFFSYTSNSIFNTIEFLMLFNIEMLIYFFYQWKFIWVWSYMQLPLLELYLISIW